MFAEFLLVAAHYWLTVAALVVTGKAYRMLKNTSWEPHRRWIRWLLVCFGMSVAVQTFSTVLNIARPLPQFNPRELLNLLGFFIDATGVYASYVMIGVLSTELKFSGENASTSSVEAGYRGTNTL